MNISDNFNHREFLSGVYKVYSFNDGVSYVKKNKNLQANNRVLNSTWIVHGSKYIVISDDLIDFYKNNKILVGDKSSIFNFFNEFIHKYHDKFSYLDNPKNSMHDIIRDEYEYFSKSKIKNI